MLGLRGLGRDGGTLRGSAPAAVVLGNLFVVLLTAPQVWPLSPVRTQDWVILVYLGVFQLGLAYTLLAAAMRNVPALQASLLMFVEPVLSPLWAWLVHRERPGLWTIAGGTIILVATAVYTWRETAGRPADTVPPSVPMI
jgi:drug/metabolite transporter, DME family